MFKETEELILASGSPRRHDLLKSCGLSFHVVVSGTDETFTAGESPEEMVRRLAIAKASSIAETRPRCWVIGADTTVVVGQKILGKPADEREAAEMLTMLQGRTHEVWGGFALLNKGKNVVHAESHCTAVSVKDLSRAEIEAYVATKEPLDKAGAYAAQGVAAAFITEIRGSYTNVVGLPLSSLINALLAFGAIKVVV